MNIFFYSLSIKESWWTRNDKKHYLKRRMGSNSCYVLNLFINFFFLSRPQAKGEEKIQRLFVLVAPRVFSILLHCNQICKHGLFFLFLSFSLTARVFAPSYNVKMHVRDGPRAGTYIYISPTESKQGQTDEHWPNNCFFYWTKNRRKLIFIGCSFNLKRGKRKGRKKEK
jgi:hypothetical protein